MVAAVWEPVDEVFEGGDGRIVVALRPLLEAELPEPGRRASPCEAEAQDQGEDPNECRTHGRPRQR